MTKTYEQQAFQEYERWKRKNMQKPSMISVWSKQGQTKINNFIPDKVHNVISESVKRMVEMTLFGSEYLSKNQPPASQTLAEQEQQVRRKIKQYQQMAAIEGAGTGAGGLLLGIADFPLLLSIKMKFLFAAAQSYGHDVTKYEERLFILQLFQLAFSSDQRKKQVFQVVTKWETHKQALVEIDWRVFQQEYRDYLDIAKLLQLIPGIGAVIGAFANYQMLDQLGEVTMNGYRSRLFDKNDVIS